MTTAPSAPASAQDLPYRSQVLSKTLLAPQIWQVRLSTPHAVSHGQVAWHFTSGQYTVLGLPEHPHAPLRPYSIASAPARDYLDLHIRDTGHGLSHVVANAVQPGSTVALGMPSGAAVPAAATQRPLVLLAGGVGIAPMVSIVEAHAHVAPCHLYWGVDDAQQLYLHSYWQKLQADGQLASYHALTRTPAAGLRDMLIGPAVIADLPDLSAFAIYLAGPAAMVAATLPLLIAHDAQKEYIFGDGITL